MFSGLRPEEAVAQQAWFNAARTGDEEAIAKLLAEWPSLATTCDGSGTALHVAAENGHDNVVALLLDAGPADLVEEETLQGRTALHLAAFGGYEKVVAHLLFAMSSASITSSKCGETALACAVDRGHDRVFKQLLAQYPLLIDKDENLLHIATARGHSNIVEHILTLRPELVSKPNRKGWTALMCAISNGHEKIAERLLEIDSDGVFEVPDDKYTLLHAATRKCSREFVAKLWQLHPEALRIACSEETPFHFAVKHKKDDLIELFQWHLTFGEIVSAFMYENANYEKRYRPLVENQCGCLFESLNRDMVDTVFEYIGFEPSHSRRTSCKRGLSLPT